MENINYAFGAGEFRLSDRVEIKTTHQRGILIGEGLHLSGCNSFQVLIPRVKKDGKMTIKDCDYLILRKLEAHEAVFGTEDNLTEENTFSPEGKTVDIDLIKTAMLNDCEPIPEIDEGIGVEELSIMPGTQVWHKVYGRPMVVLLVCRNIYKKELEYGLLYMESDQEVIVFDSSYALLPMEELIEIYPDEDDKKGPIFGDMRPAIGKRPFYENTASSNQKPDTNNSSSLMLDGRMMK